MVFGSKTLTLSDWTSQVSASRLTLQIFLAHGLPLHLVVSLYVSVVHSTCDAIIHVWLSSSFGFDLTGFE